MSLGELVRCVGNAIDNGASEEEVCEVINEKFIDVWFPDGIFDMKLGADIRGAIVAAYKLGKQRGIAACPPTTAERTEEDQIWDSFRDGDG